MSLSTNITLDDFSSLFAYSSGWDSPDTSARNFASSSPFLSSLVDGTYHETGETGANATLSFTGQSSLPLEAACVAPGELAAPEWMESDDPRTVRAALTCGGTGTAIYLYGMLGPRNGFFDVKLDAGATSTPVSAFAQTNTTNHLLWSATGLPNSAHTVVVTNRGARDGSGDELFIDYALGTAIVGAAG